MPDTFVGALVGISVHSHVTNSLILITDLSLGYCYNPHFPVDKTEVKKKEKSGFNPANLVRTLKYEEILLLTMYIPVILAIWSLAWS